MDVKQFIADNQGKYEGYSQLEKAWLMVFSFCDSLGMQDDNESSGLELVLNFINNLKEV